jgi:Fasciclin domain
MADRTRVLRATMLAAPLGALALFAQAQAQDTDVPSSPHQEQVLHGEQQGEQPGSQQLSTGQPQTGTQEVPSSPHQEQVLRGQQGGEQQQPSTTPQTEAQGSDMPSSPHQEQVLRGEQPQSSQQDTGMLREATVIEPDIQADNGIIHAIDAVLVPQSVLLELESMGQEKQSQGQPQQSKAKQG